VENSVPDEAIMPYITYRLAEPDWDEPMSMYAKVYYRTTSFAGISATIDEINQALKNGKSFSFDGGYIALFKDSNFCQFMNDEDEAVKAAYLSYIMHAVEV
jgi:hypothetical protein